VRTVVERSEAPTPGIQLTLYVSGSWNAGSSARAAQAARKARDAFAPGELTLDEVDLALDPSRAETDHVVYTPCLVVRHEGRCRNWVGDLSAPGIEAGLRAYLTSCGARPV
jgi:hypothetical protein